MPITDAAPGGTRLVPYGPPQEAELRRSLTPNEEVAWLLHPDRPYDYTQPGNMEPRHQAPVARRRPRHSPSPTSKDAERIIVPHWDDQVLDAKSGKLVDVGALWDQIVINGFTFTGTVRIEGDGPKLSVDRHKKKGAVHTRLIANGYDTTELQIILRVWLKEHLEDFSALVSEINPKQSGVPYAIEVYNPMLELAKIKKVLVYGVGFLQATGTPGLRESTLRCFEFIEPTNKKTSATRRVTAAPARNPNLDPFFHTTHDQPLASPSPSATSANP